VQWLTNEVLGAIGSLSCTRYARSAIGTPLQSYVGVTLVPFPIASLFATIPGVANHRKHETESSYAKRQRELQPHNEKRGQAQKTRGEVRTPVVHVVADRPGR
jgi:hypothetical protein